MTDWNRDIKNEMLAVLLAEWGDHFLIDDRESHEGFTLSRGMLDDAGAYMVQRITFGYADACENPARVAEDLRRILAADDQHAAWVEAPAPVQQEFWLRTMKRLAEAIDWNKEVFAIDEMVDAVIDRIGYDWDEAGRLPSSHGGWVEAVMVAAVRFSTTDGEDWRKDGAARDFIEGLAPRFVGKPMASKEECIHRLAALLELEDGVVRKTLRAGLGGVAP